MSKDNVTRRISIFVNGKEVENSLKGVEGAMAQVRNRMRLLNSDSESYDKDSKELAKTMNDLRQRQSEYRDELGLTNKAMKESNEISGGLRGTLTGIWDSLASGDLQGAKEGIGSLTSGMGGLVKSSLAFIATPIGAAIAGLAGLAVGAKAMFDFNVNAEKGAQLIENLSGKTGQVVEDIRVRIQSLTDTFGIGFNELAAAVDNLVDTGVAKDELEALEKIKNGLLTAPDKNEFISSLENSAVTAKQVGLDLEEVISLKKSIEETGVNPEATFGALQKAGKNLALQTDALRSSLSEAFGAAFTDEVLAKVKNGQLTTVQALDLINNKSKEVGLNQTQQAEIGAQLFGKAAQSAGGFATILDTVSGGLNKQNQELNSNQKAIDDLEKANLKLGQAQSELFRVKNFGEIWTGIKASVTDTFASILQGVSDTKKDIGPLIELVNIAFANAWENLKFTFGVAFDFISGTLKIVSNQIKTFINFFKSVLKGDFKGAIDALKQGLLNFGNIIGDTFGKIKNRIISNIKGIVDNIAPVLKALGFNVENLQKKLDSFKNKEVEIKTKSSNSSTTTGNKEDTKKLKEELAEQQKIRNEASKQAAAKKKSEEEKAAKEEYDRAKALTDAKANLAKVQLDQYVTGLRSQLEKGKELTPESIAIENERLQKIKDAQIKFNNEELARKIADLEAKGKLEGTSQEVINAQKEALNLEYQMKNQELELGFQQSTDALKLQYEQEQKILKAEQLALDNELALLDAETKAEADKIKQEQDYQAELQRYAKLYADKKITDEEYTRFKDAAKKKQDEIDRVRELQQLQGTLGGLNQVAGAIGEMFGQSKELAIVQAGINGAMAVTSILAQYPKFDGGFAMWAAIAAAGITTIAQVSKIAGAKPPKAPKFFFGGNTGSTAALGYDEYGPVTGYVHKNEYVIPESMTQDPRFANTIGWLEANRQAKLRGYVDGGATSPGAVPSSATASNETAMLVSALNTLNSILSAGIVAKTVIGYQEVRDLNDMSDEISNSTKNGTIG
jgi:hypothetical protein